MDRPSSSAPVTRVWGSPQKGFFKLNTDGSWIGLDNAGGGGVIRRDKGLWQEGYAINFNAMSGAAAELLAIREGLLTAWKREIKHLELETDADALCKMLKDHDSFKDRDLGNIIRDVASLLDRNWTVIIFHASRTVNQIADWLAAIGRSKVKKGEKETYYYPPAVIFENYAAEIPDLTSAT